MTTEEWRAELERLWEAWSENSAAYTAAWMVHGTGATYETLRRLDACRERENALLERLSAHLALHVPPEPDQEQRLERVRDYRTLWEGEDNDG